VKLREPVYICGPTAVGKSAVAMELARRLGGEIISVDSMQVYCGMDIGTAKPSHAERAEITHHLIDVATLVENFDAARFVELARKAQSEIQARGKLPIFCGGTGLYFNALLKGLGDAPPSDASIRAELEATPLHLLLQELKQRDPNTWEAIDRNNGRRVIRALEVIRITGKPFSNQRAEWKSAPPAARIFGIAMDRDALAARIDSRVDRMFAAGLVEETKALVEQGLRENRTALQALGYKQTLDLLDGKSSLPETIDLVKLRTRQFEKRQRTWFKGQLLCHWIDVAPAQPATEIAEQLIDEYKLV
jgi:tRNA dimethylallyltransferase